LLVDHRSPKRPAGAFMSFYATKFQSLEGNAVSEKAKAAAKQWASMTDAEKKVRLIRITYRLKTDF